MWRRNLAPPARGEFIPDDELRAELERRELDPSGPRTALLERMEAALGAAITDDGKAGDAKAKLLELERVKSGALKLPYF